MPAFKNHLALNFVKGLKLFLNVDAGVTRGPVPDPERDLRQARSRIEEQRRRLEQMRRRVSEKDGPSRRALRGSPGSSAARGGPRDAGAPPLPIPTGQTEESLRKLVTSIRVEGAPVQEFINYATADFKRFVYTLGLVPDSPGMKVLELGSNPYFTTTLLRTFRDAELHLGNYFGMTEQEGTQKVTVQETGEEIPYHFKHFNLEKERFPYEDDAFDVVLFCEIIEHLLADPVHALLEMRRVLKPDGSLVLTTPNATRLENLAKMIDGQNIYDPYSGYGPYGRHNREYTRHELAQLLSANGFELDESFTADVHANYRPTHVTVEEIKALTKFRATDLGQYHFTRSTALPDSKQLPPSRPDWLYRSFHDDQEPESPYGVKDGTSS